ncbi:MAG: glycosyltransferase family 1 protein [Gemmatimonadetes bacterium]|nr:glycosyltransferase family 1 protein [Gemmatimonadota bacterium]
MKLVVLNWLDRENPSSGGAEIHLHESFGRLARRGWEITVVVSGWPGAPQRAHLDGLDVHRVGGRYSYGALAARYVRREWGLGGFDLLVEDLNKVPVFFPTWSPWPGVLLVHHLFGTTAFREAALPLALSTWLLERPIPRVYRDVDVVAVSESTKADLVRRGLRRERITVIENGVDLASFSPPPDGGWFDEPTILYLGRLKRYKRVDLIIDAVAGLRREGEAARLLVAGEGDHRNWLESHARSLGLGGEEVRFLGRVSESEKAELLGRAWVHVLTSPKEGWGISILEAGACGTPSVASDSPGLRDSVLHDRTGFLVPHGDVAALAGRLKLLLRDVNLRVRMGRAAREFAGGFTWERSAERLALALETAVASG